MIYPLASSDISTQDAGTLAESSACAGIRAIRAQVVQVFSIARKGCACSALIVQKSNHKDAVKIVSWPPWHLSGITTGQLDHVFDKIVQIPVFPGNENGCARISRLQQFLL